MGQWSASEAAHAETFTDFVAASKGTQITLTIDRNARDISISATPRLGIAPGDPTRYALGLSIAPIGIVPLSLGQSVVQGAQLTWAVTEETAVGLVHFLVGIFTFSANLSQVSGPIGIENVVAGAAHQGWGDLLSIAALISINLALINLLPIPALDGGRLLFVIIESVTRRPIKREIANTLNSIFFALLILLMVVISAHDIYLRVIG